MNLRAKLLFGPLFCLFVFFQAASAPAGGWYAYRDCELMSDLYGDGDSFHVKTKRAQHVFRLYFVDAPETDRLIPVRVKEQAEYWDISEDAVIELGNRARAFTRKFLEDGKGFTVHSKRKDARGRSRTPRYFAMVQAGEQFLSEALVGNGLARVYGMGTDLPDGKPARKYWARLRHAERKAKKEGAGGWAGRTSNIQQPTRNIQ